MITELSPHPSSGSTQAEAAATVQQPSCEECVGTGGWYRYEPALDPAPGLLYMSCIQCRGSGRLALAKA